MWQGGSFKGSLKVVLWYILCWVCQIQGVCVSVCDSVCVVIEIQPCRFCWSDQQQQCSKSCTSRSNQSLLCEATTKRKEKTTNFLLRREKFWVCNISNSIQKWYKLRYIEFDFSVLVDWI